MFGVGFNTKRWLLQIIIIGTVLFNFMSVWASWYTDDSKRGHQGWYGYEKYERKEKKKAKKEEQTKIVVESPQKVEKWPLPDELYKMKTQEIKEWVEKAGDEAISNPTEENIKRWIQYMEIVDRKATEFASMWAWVVQNNPDFYKEAALTPIVTPGKKARWKTIWQEISKLLNNKYDEYALLFFYKENDHYSDAMDVILKQFKENHKEWIIKYINFDNQKEVLARKLGVTYAPQIWLLARRDKRRVPLAAGPISVIELEKKIYHTIKVIEGDIPPQYFQNYPWYIPSNSTSK